MKLNRKRPKEQSDENVIWHHHKNHLAAKLNRANTHSSNSTSFTKGGLNCSNLAVRVGMK